MDHSTNSQPELQTYYPEWVSRLEHYSQELLHHLAFIEQQDESKLEQLVHGVMTHYHEYFLAKARVLRHDVFQVLSPSWLTAYERSFLWLGGFKPSFTIYVARRCGIEFSTDQAEKFEKMVEEIKTEETEITERLARLEQQMVSPRILALARMAGKEVNGMMNEADAVVDRMAEDMETLVRCADYLREKTVGKIVEMLKNAQTVRFFAGIVLVQLRIRRWGLVWESGSHGDANLA